MSFHNNKLSEDENIRNKIADIRALIWHLYPDNQGEMICDPYSCLVYIEDFVKKAINQKNSTEELEQVLDKRNKQISRVIDERYLLKSFIEMLTNSDDVVLCYAAKECLNALMRDER